MVGSSAMSFFVCSIIIPLFFSFVYDTIQYHKGGTMEKLQKDHPYLTVTITCILLFFFGFCRKKNLSFGSYVYADFLSLLFLALISFRLNPFGERKKNCLFFFLTSAYVTGSFLLTYLLHNQVTILLWAFLLLLLAITAALKKNGTLTMHHIVLFLLALGIAFRFVYVLYTGSTIRQHDMGDWLGIEGHSTYIEYWYKNGLKLPDFDVRKIFQFYQPPLHHILMALMLKLLTNFGMEYRRACEAIQFLPFLYSSLSLVVCLRIFRWMKLDGIPLLTSFALICFYPTLIIHSGYYNNDGLAILFMLLTILLALKWHRDPTLKRILPLALTIGLGMMTKLSAWMMAPGVAFLFLSRFLESSSPKLRLIKQFSIFGIISFPLGLWWPVRNFLLFGVPLTYIPSLGRKSPQYCGDISKLRRIFDFGSGRLKYVYSAYTQHGAPFNDFNPGLSLVKTSLFDEQVSELIFPSIKYTGPCLFALGICMCLLCTISFCVITLRKNRAIDKVTRYFFLIHAIVLLAFYYLFCFKYPFVCTMNIRYVIPLIPLFALGQGLCMQESSGKKGLSKLWKTASLVLTILFCLASCIVYTQVGVYKPIYTNL